MCSVLDTTTQSLKRKVNFHLVKCICNHLYLLRCLLVSDEHRNSVRVHGANQRRREVCPCCAHKCVCCVFFMEGASHTNLILSVIIFFRILTVLDCLSSCRFRARRTNNIARCLLTTTTSTRTRWWT